MAHTVPLIGQGKTLGCWAAGFSMMYSWRQAATTPIAATLQKLGPPYPGAYASNSGITSFLAKEALDKLNLQREPPANPTAARWLQLVAASPLFVVVDEEPNPNKFAVHARVVFDIKTDAANTVLYNDPGANNLMGAVLSQPLAQFVSDYEALAGTGWAGVQIVHY
jgi:hypothetical protein